MKVLRLLVFTTILMCFFSVRFADAQQSMVFTHPDQLFFEGQDLFSKQKYVAAQDRFGRVVAQYPEQAAGIPQEASFYHALCAAELYNNDTEYLLSRYVKNYPESPHINEAYYALGKFAYNQHQYSSTIKWFAEVEPMDLEQEDLEEYYFKKGFSYFKTKKYEEARVAFYEILEGDGPYISPAIYYYSHIQYEQKNYETSLKGFLRLKDDETFAAIVPYYVSQIYYLQEKWDEVVAYAPPLLDSVTENRYAEMAKIIGESYFQLDQYKEAVSYLEKYHEKTNFSTPQDKYQMAFAYYMTGEYQKATDYFQGLSTGSTELSQSAMYHLADCYMHLGDKYQARMSFAAAARMSHNKKITEDALFNYAVVTYELALSPFNEAVQAFNRYILTYPGSDRIDEAYNYLVLAYMGTKNYKAALASLERIKRKTPDIEKAYQRVAFFRGLELFHNLSFLDAINKFDASLKYGENDDILRALCYYWKGESYYRLNDFDQAIVEYDRFMSSDGVYSLEEYITCHYNLGYVNFKKGEYREALTWFRRFESLNKGRPSQLIADAFNRIGDMYFIDAKYQQAIEYYDRAIELKLVDVDYALYQKALSDGVLNRHQDKINILGILLKEHEKSTFRADALYETGRSYFIIRQTDRSIEYYTRLLNEFPNSSYVSRTLLQLGLIYYNGNQDGKSIEYYKKVVSDYPGTSEANTALLGIKNVYVENNQVDEYFAYVRSLGGEVDVNSAERDSLSYLAAENVYMGGDCEKSIISFAEYIRQFEDGRYLVDAHFYKAECHLKSDQFKEALEAFDYVTAQPRNVFTEPALVSASRINMLRKDYPAALKDYLLLEGIAELKSNLSEAGIGKMRCYYHLGEYGNTIDAARMVLREEKISEELKREAHFKIARSFYEQDRFALALEEFKIVAAEVSSIEGAESKYHVAEIFFIQKEYEKSKEEIFKFAEQNTVHQYWVAKSFILLSDIYMVMEDEFQAVQTLQSIIDYYEDNDDGILDLARRKKASFNAGQESKEEKAGEEPGIDMQEEGGINPENI